MEINDQVKPALSVPDKRLKSYSTCELSFAVSKNDDQYKIYFGSIKFLHEKDEKPKEELYEYGNFIMFRKLVSAEEGNKLIKELIKNETITITGFGTIQVSGQQLSNPMGSSYIAGQQAWGYSYGRFEWPSVRLEYTIKPESAGRLPSGPLSSVKNPIYPYAQYALADFFKADQNFNPPGNKIEIILPDFRARISKAKMLEKKIKFEIESRDVKETDLVAKFYIQNQGSCRKSDNLEIKDGLVVIDYEEEPQFIQLNLMSIKDGDDIDNKFVYTYRSEPWQEVDPEAYETLITRLIQEGENNKVEFKQDLNKQGRGFLETISAFSNGEGGIILLGVSDDAKVEGFTGNKDSVTDMIANNFEEYPVFNIIEVKINGISVMALDIEKGPKKPYYIRNRGTFIRKNATTRQASGSEVAGMKQSGGGLSWH